MSPDVLQQAEAGLDGALGRYELSAEEKDALKIGDPRRLRQLGAHGMLALYILRLNPEFRENIYWSQK
jgi:hypothetical protein